MRRLAPPTSCETITLKNIVTQSPKGLQKKEVPASFSLFYRTIHSAIGPSLFR